MDDFTKIGVVFFDNPDEPSTLSYSIDGGSVHKVNSISYLDNTVNWITNLTFKQFGKSILKLAKHKGISAESAIKPGLLQLSKEFKQKTTNETIQVLSKIVNRLSRLSAKYHNRPIENYLYLEHLKDEIKTSIGPKPTEEYLSAIQNATQSFQNNSGERFKPPYVMETLHLPFAAYARWIVSRPVPSGMNWKKIATQNKVLGKQDSDDLLNHLNELHKHKAMFFKVKVRLKDKSKIEFASFGVGADTRRVWATYPEIKKLQDYYYVTLIEGFSCPFTELTVPDYFSARHDFSIAQGLLMLNYAQALMQPISNVYDPIACYLKAYDRCELLYPIANTFVEAGYSIASYGAGKITLCLRAPQIESAVKLGYQLGLVTRKHDFQIANIHQRPVCTENILPSDMANLLENDWLAQIMILQAISEIDFTNEILTLDQFTDLPLQEQWAKAQCYISDEIVNKFDAMPSNGTGIAIQQTNDDDDDDDEIIVL